MPSSNRRALAPDEITFWIGYGLLLPVSLAPLFVTRLMPGLDLGFHLAIVDMLHKVGTPESPHGAIFEGRFGVKPYALYYFLVYAFSKLWSINVAHKIVLGLYVAALPATTGALLKGLGRSPLPALLAFPLAYNMNLHYGFLSFCISLPVVLGYLALVTRLRETNPPRWTYAALTVLAMVLFLGHAQTFFLGVLTGGLVMTIGAPTWKRRLLYAGTLLPALSLLVYWQAQGIFHTPDNVPRKDMLYVLKDAWAHRLTEVVPTRTQWDEIVARMTAGLRVHSLRGFRDRVDERMVELWIGTLGLYTLGILIFTLIRDRLQPWRRLSRYLFGLIPLFVVTALYLALPHHLPELATLYPRFAIVVMVMMLLLPGAAIRRLRFRWAALCALPAIALSGWYGAQVARHYVLYGREIADFLAVVDRAPPNKKMIGLLYGRDSAVMNVESAWAALPSFYVVLRPGPKSLMNLIYCPATQVPCKVKDSKLLPPDPGAWAQHTFDQDRALAYFDLFLVHTGNATPHELIKQLKPFARSGKWHLYENDPVAQSTKQAARRTVAPPGAVTSASKRL